MGLFEYVDKQVELDVDIDLVYQEEETAWATSVYDVETDEETPSTPVHKQTVNFEKVGY